mmetsp:Transcript_28732/g.51993  ORF Transcript_28732/g.51993 Transcript_28732/m.51993 type:complete len:95 (-) Transcript_28732:203-487(-)
MMFCNTQSTTSDFWLMRIDEIGRPQEVEAVRTCKNRGVRLIASAHGDLRKLIENPKLLWVGMRSQECHSGRQASKNERGCVPKDKVRTCRTSDI